MVAGIAGANFSIAQAAVADVTEPKDRARNFGMIGAAFGIGFILGPLLGGWIAGSTGIPSLPFLFAGILGIINLSLVFFRFSETHVPTSTHKGSLPIFFFFFLGKKSYLTIFTSKKC
jgi:DHA1 family tetracycline resistance protein-like MFS transporter